jgi:hypothetical protein
MAIPQEHADTIELIKEKLEPHRSKEHVETTMTFEDAEAEAGLEILEIAPTCKKAKVTDDKTPAYWAVLFKDSDERIYIRIALDGKLVDVFLT